MFFLLERRSWDHIWSWPFSPFRRLLSFHYLLLNVLSFPSRTASPYVFPLVLVYSIENQKMKEVKVVLHKQYPMPVLCHRNWAMICNDFFTGWHLVFFFFYVYWKSESQLEKFHCLPRAHQSIALLCPAPVMISCKKRKKKLWSEISTFTN